MGQNRQQRPEGSAADARKARLARALKANLRRRKAQARSRGAADTEADDAKHSGEKRRDKA